MLLRVTVGRDLQDQDEYLLDLRPQPLLPGLSERQIEYLRGKIDRREILDYAERRLRELRLDEWGRKMGISARWSAVPSKRSEPRLPHGVPMDSGGRDPARFATRAVAPLA